MSEGRGEGIAWFKIVMFCLITLMLAGIASVILDSGLGTPDESRRLRHPAGFSIVYPQGWGGTVGYAQGAAPNSIRLAPERVTGRQTSIAVTRSTRAPKLADTAKATTFQDRPAWATMTQFKRDATYRVDFERDGAWYAVVLSAPVEQKWESDPLMTYARTFRTEATIHPATAAVPTTATVEP